MSTRNSLLAVVAASAAALAPAGALAGPWTFTKSPDPWARYAVAAPAQAVDAMIFGLTATGVAPTRVTRMSFMVLGSARAGDVANYQLVYFPSGLASPGVVVGTNDGAAWAPTNSTTRTLTIDLSTPIDVQGTFAGSFALRVDLNGARTFFFQPQLQTVTTDGGGAAQLVRDTDDLPLHGDTFAVN